ncbi:Uncharacterised protein [Enterobacter hormaechei]|nr:Uncharacterised protein [Enterobacter hormaechei]
MKFHLQRRIKQHRFAVHLIDVVLQFIHFVRPVFRHNKQRLRGHLLDVLNPLFIEPGRDVFYRVQAEAVAVGLLHHPARPVFDLLRHRVVAKINIFTHQVIEIAHLVVDLIVPAFAGVVVHDFEDTVLIGVFNVVDTAKAFVIPNELRILAGPSGEGVARPGFAFDDLIADLGAILRIHALHADGFLLIGPHFVVDHHVQKYRNLVAF